MATAQPLLLSPLLSEAGTSPLLLSPPPLPPLLLLPRDCAMSTTAVRSCIGEALPAARPPSAPASVPVPPFRAWADDEPPSLPQLLLAPRAAPASPRRRIASSESAARPAAAALRLVPAVRTWALIVGGLTRTAPSPLPHRCTLTAIATSLPRSLAGLLRWSCTATATAGASAGGWLLRGASPVGLQARRGLSALRACAGRRVYSCLECSPQTTTRPQLMKHLSRWLARRCEPWARAGRRQHRATKPAG